MKLVLGTMEMGRRLSLENSKRMTEKFLELGFNELDTASLYANGETEKILGNFLPTLTSGETKIATKVNPSWMEMGFEPEAIVKQFNTCLKNLGLNKVDMLYLHWPSKETNIEKTLSVINKLYSEDKISRFGLSNYAAWEVSKICGICERAGFLMPTVYQGMYNVLTRSVEDELFPCIRDYGISFYAYNPLAGGLLTGRYQYEDRLNFDDKTTPNRFYKIGGTKWAQAYQDRFWKKGYFDALDEIQSLQPANKVLSKDGVFVNEWLIKTSFSWLKNHSKLDVNKGDAIILGASSIDQFNLNMDLFFSCNPLTEQQINHIDKCYVENIAGHCPKYHR